MKHIKLLSLFLTLCLLLCACAKNQTNEIDGESHPVQSIALSKEDVATGTYLMFNCKKEPFDSALVRRAFAFAIDNSKLAEMSDSYKALEGFVPSNVPYGLDRKSTFREKTELLFIQNDQFAKLTYSRAGYTIDDEFPPFTLISYGNEDFALEILNCLEDILPVSGEVKLLQSKAELDKAISDGEYDMALMDISCAEDMQKFFEQFVISFDNSKYSNVLNELSTVSDTETYDKMFLYEMAEGILFDEMPAVPLVYTEK